MDDIPERWTLCQFLREDWLKQVVEEDEREGNQSGDRICSRIQECKCKRGSKN